MILLLRKFQMTNFSNRPEFWKSRLRDHLSSQNPQMFEELVNNGDWPNFQNSIAEQAQSLYQQKFSQYKESGANDKTGSTFSQSEVLRELILVIGINTEEMPEEPDEEMDSDYLYFLSGFLKKSRQ